MKQTKPNSRYLRKNQTEAERILWRYLRNRNFVGYKFRRQYVIDHYILDFYCPQARLGIELDGGHHSEDEVAEYDKIRTIHIESHAVRIMRFWNIEIKRNINSVLETVFYYLENSD